MSTTLYCGYCKSLVPPLGHLCPGYQAPQTGADNKSNALMFCGYCGTPIAALTHKCLASDMVQINPDTSSRKDPMSIERLEQLNKETCPLGVGMGSPKDRQEMYEIIELAIESFKLKAALDAALAELKAIELGTWE